MFFEVSPVVTPINLIDLKKQFLNKTKLNF